MSAALPTFDIRAYREEFGARIMAAFEVSPLLAAMPVLGPLISPLVVLAILLPQFSETIVFAVVALLAVGAAIWFGVALASLLLTRRWLLTIAEVLTLVPDFLAHVAKDMEALHGGAEVPAHEAADLSVRAYDSVLLPLITETIETQYGFVGGFACWVYRRTMSGLVRSLIGKAVTESAGEKRRDVAIGVLREGAKVGAWLGGNFGRLVKPARVAATVVGVLALCFSGFLAFVLPSIVLAVVRFVAEVS